MHSFCTGPLRSGLLLASKAGAMRAEVMGWSLPHSGRRGNGAFPDGEIGVQEAHWSGSGGRLP